jgi:flagellar basal-body rod protein FlgG
MQSLYTAATGMLAQQMNIDVISNNLANVNTNGYKKQRVDFQDLLYLNVKPAGAPATRETHIPVGIQVGDGVRPVSTQRSFSQGAVQNTDNPLDILIESQGYFFKVTRPTARRSIPRRFVQQGRRGQHRHLRRLYVGSRHPGAHGRHRHRHFRYR